MIVRENIRPISFQRGIDPKKALNVGMVVEWPKIAEELKDILYPIEDVSKMDWGFDEYDEFNITVDEKVKYKDPISGAFYTVNLLYTINADTESIHLQAYLDKQGFRVILGSGNKMEKQEAIQQRDARGLADQISRMEEEMVDSFKSGKNY